MLHLLARVAGAISWLHQHCTRNLGSASPEQNHAVAAVQQTHPCLCAGFTCQQQRSWGKCSEPWMTEVRNAHPRCNALSLITMLITPCCALPLTLLAVLRTLYGSWVILQLQLSSTISACPQAVCVMGLSQRPQHAHISFLLVTDTEAHRCAWTMCVLPPLPQGGFCRVTCGVCSPGEPQPQPSQPMAVSAAPTAAQGAQAPNGDTVDFAPPATAPQPEVRPFSNTAPRLA